MRKLVMGAILVWVGLFLALGATAATIKGSVKDQQTDENMPGANVFLKGTSFGTATDRTGHYTIPNVPAGDYTLIVSYLGYEEWSKGITVSGDETLTEHITIQSSVLEGEEIIVGGMRAGQARALNQQRTAANIKNVVAYDQIGRFPDLNSAEALQRIPSLSVQRDQGEGRYVLIRGTEARLNSVTINGERVPSPEGDIRSVALDVIPSDAISTIEVNKALTPDMDADAIGGSINLKTKSALDYNKPVLKATLAGGYNELMEDANYQGAFTYGTKLGANKQFGVMLNASYFNTARGSDNIELEWGDVDDVDVVEEMQLRDYDVTRDRLGLSANFDYNLNPQTTFNLRAIYNQFGDQEYRRTLIPIFGDGEFTNVTANGGSVEEAVFERELKDRYEVQRIYSISGGGSHDLARFDVDYNLAYSYAEEEEPDRQDIVFVMEDVNLDYDLSDRNFPKYNITNGLDPHNPASYEFDELVLEDNLTTDQDLTGRIDLKMPYNLSNGQGELKFGFKYRAKEKDLENDVRIYDGYDGDFTLDMIASDFEDENFLDDKYKVGTGPDHDKLEDMVDRELNKFELDSDATREDTDAENFDATEDILAGYVMTELHFGDLMVLPGVRYEMTDLEYNANEVILNEDGDYEATNPVSVSNDYANMLPMLHLRYRLNDRTNLRTAITTSLARPNYFDLAPYRLVNREDEEIEIGNPALEPTQAVNFDLFFEHYLPSLGSVTGGFFYKDLSDYIYHFTYENEDGYEVVQPQNGESASLMGFELALSQQMTFLPDFWNGFGIYANYTYTDSEAEFPEREGEKATLPGQSTHMANLALSYEKYGFSGRLAWNYHGKYIDEVGGDETEDIYYDNHAQLDLSLSQKVRAGLSLFAEFVNLTDEPLRYYEGKDNEDTRVIQQEYYSWWSHIGLKYEF